MARTTQLRVGAQVWIKGVADPRPWYVWSKGPKAGEWWLTRDGVPYPVPLRSNQLQAFTLVRSTIPNTATKAAS